MERVDGVHSLFKRYFYEKSSLETISNVIDDSELSMFGKNVKPKANEVFDTFDIKKDNVNDILKYEVIYVIGGDPRYLLDLVATTNVKEILKQFLKSGGIYIGESAGSMILGNNLKWIWEVKKGTKPKYDIEPESYEGLGFTNYNIFPHWNATKENIKKKALEHNETITPLSDGEFIEVEYK